MIRRLVATKTLLLVPKMESKHVSAIVAGRKVGPGVADGAVTADPVAIRNRQREAQGCSHPSYQIVRRSAIGPRTLHLHVRPGLEGAFAASKVRWMAMIDGKTKPDPCATALAAWPRTQMVRLTTHYVEPCGVNRMGNGGRRRLFGRTGLLRDLVFAQVAAGVCRKQVADHQSISGHQRIRKGSISFSGLVWDASNRRSTLPGFRPPTAGGLA